MPPQANANAQKSGIKKTTVEPNRHVEFHADPTSEDGGVVMQIGDKAIRMTGMEFFRLLKAAKDHGRDWGAGDRPNRADIRDAMRTLAARKAVAQ